MSDSRIRRTDGLTLRNANGGFYHPGLMHNHKTVGCTRMTIMSVRNVSCNASTSISSWGSSLLQGKRSHERVFSFLLFDFLIVMLTSRVLLIYYIPVVFIGQDKSITAKASGGIDLAGERDVSP